MPTITIFDVIANDPVAARKAIQVMEDFGYNVQARSEAEMVFNLKAFVRTENRSGNGEKAIKALAMVHPDRELILSTANVSHGFDGFPGYENPRAMPTPATTAAASPSPLPAPSDHTALLLTIFMASALFLSVAIVSKSK
jgi:hypothetical protein